MNENKVSKLEIIGVTLLLIAFTAFAIALMASSNNYPTGSDIYAHLFRGRVLYNAIKDGTGYPIYSANWYSGIELFRYWPAASYLFYSLFIFLAGGNIYSAYLYFTFAIFFIGAFAWVLFGVREKQIWTGLLIGCLFFFLPDNMRVFFDEGNMPRAFITCLLPYVFYFLTGYVFHGRKRNLIGLNLVISIIVCSHIMISAMVGITIFVFLLIDVIMHRTWKRQLVSLIMSVFGYLNVGIILLPGLTGGLLSRTSSSDKGTSELWSQNIFLSFNPINRMNHFDMFYFGISILLVCVFGILVMRRDTLPGFLTCLLIFLGTSTSAAKVIAILPLGQALWMTRFVPIASVLFLFAFLRWKELKPLIKFVFFILIIIDCYLTVVTIGWKDRSYTEVEQAAKADYFLEEGFDIVENKVALMDLSTLGAYPSLYATERGTGNYIFGSASQGADNIDKIVSLNESFKKGYFTYMFDRAIEYGCDVVIIKKDCIEEEKLDKLQAAAELLGYELVDDNVKASLYKLNVDGQFGTINKIRNIAVGEGANDICFVYPSFHKTSSDYLDDYSFEELSQYDNIYLSHFYCRNREACEDMITRLAQNGVKIFVDMNGVPEDLSRGRNHFLGAYAQSVAFTEVFPVIENNNGHEYKLGSTNDNYSVWRTVYITDAPVIIKSSQYEPARFLNYLAKDETGNITFIGLNLMYFYIENGGTDLKQFLDETFNVPDSEFIVREIVPQNVTYDTYKVTIETDADNVNTNVNALDCFEGKYDISDKTIIVNKGITEINVKYAYFKEGLLVSIIGIILSITLFVIVAKKGDYDEKKITEDDVDSSSSSAC